MRSLIFRKAPMFSPDSGFAPDLQRQRGMNPVVAMFLIWDARHKARHDLKHLPDHMLTDIGVTRQIAKREAEKPFWRP